MKKEMLINVLQPEECRIAIVEDGVLEELYVERTSHENYTGNIYKGRIVNLEPAIQAAFVDFSVGRNGFLHVSDVEPQYYSQADEPEPAPAPAPPAAAGDSWERPPQQQVQSGPRRERDRDRPRDRDRDREGRRGPSAAAPAPQAPPTPPPAAPPAHSRMEDSWPVIDRFDPLWESDEEPRGQGPAAFGGAAAPPDEPPQDRPRPPRRRGDRGRDRDRERPDHMDRRRRPAGGGGGGGDSRSFGEGLFEELFGSRAPRPEPEPAWDIPRPAPAPAPAPVESAPAPAPSPVEPPEAPQSYGRAEAPAPAPPARERGRDRDRDRERGREAAPAAESRGRYAPQPFDDDVEAYLPPNRNQRSRVPAPRREPERPAPAPAPEPPTFEEVSWRPIEQAPAPAPAPSRSRRPEPEAPAPAFGESIDEGPAEDGHGPASGERSRRRRGRRGRGGRHEEQAPEPVESFSPAIEQPEADFFEEPPADLLEPAPPFDEDEEEDFPELPPPPPRRGGRDAIRARGGDRPAPPRPAPESHSFGEPSIHRPAPSLPPARPAPARREPPRPREGGLHERPAAPAPAPFAPRGEAPPEAAPESPAAPRRRPAPRAAEPPPTHHRQRPAPEHGKPGEPDYVPRSLRDSSPQAPAPFPPYAEIDEDEPEGDVYEAEDLAVGEGGPAGDESDPGKRKRRRRRRRRGDQPETEARGPEPRAEEPRPARGRGRPVEVPVDDDDEHPGDDFDFSEAASAIDEEEDEVHEDEGAVAVSDPDDVIDPELEAEIRREIAEIEELERNMGLRATTEARPRRADAAAGIKARGGIKPPIQDIFRRGDEVLLQVIKESIGTKGPTLSTYISIPGRYLVLMPGLNRVGVSRKIADESQRRKLREIMQELNPPKGLGFIVRTAGMDRSKRELARDMAYLLRLWKTILMRIKKTKGPAPIYQESDLITRTIRDIFSDGIDTIWIDEPAAFERAQEFMRNVMPHFADRVKLYDGKVPLFHKYGLEEEIQKIHRKVVPLAGGGSIVIEQTEALVAIDVNSGNFRVENDAERTAYETNLKAAREIARQLRLRDLGGVIINDFIDMREERHRRGVEKAIRDAVKRDRARTKILRMSQFGIIEMTRQRIRPSLKNSVYEPCPRCQASGLVKTAESMAIDVTRMLMLACHRPEVRRVNITVSPSVALYLNNKKRQEIARLEGIGNVMIYIREAEDAPADHLKMDCYDANNAEVRLFPGAQSSSPSRR